MFERLCIIKILLWKLSQNFVDTFLSAREQPTSLSKWYLHSLICAAACSVWLSRADRNLCHCGSMYLKYNSITTMKKYIEGWGDLKATKCKYFFLLLHTEITIKVIIDLQCPCLTLTRNTGGGHNWHLAKKSTSLHPHHSLCSDSDWGARSPFH